jgi:hypothetical protein
MTPLRADLTTFANIKDFFDISLKAMVESVNRIAVVNPEYELATDEEKDKGAVDRILIRLPACMGTMDEMPLTLNVNTGQSDKKFSGYGADIADIILSEGITATWAVDFVDAARNGRKGPILCEDNSKKSTLRGGKRARVRSTKFNKVGTLVMGSIANGDPYIPLIIIRSAKLAKEHTFSIVEGDDGSPMRVTLPKLRIARQNRDAFIVATLNGGINKDLFAKYLDLCIFPCHPLMSAQEQCIFGGTVTSPTCCQELSCANTVTGGLSSFHPSPTLQQTLLRATL